MGTDTEPLWEKQGREAVNTAAASGKELTPDFAAQLICQLIAGAARKTKDTRKAVVGVCHGAMTALALHHANLPESAVETLKGLTNISLSSRSDPSELMTWILEGFAEATVVAGFGERVEIQHRIDSELHGVGEVFDKLCDAVKKRGANPS